MRFMNRCLITIVIFSQLILGSGCAVKPEKIESRSSSNRESLSSQTQTPSAVNAEQNTTDTNNISFSVQPPILSIESTNQISDNALTVKVVYSLDEDTPVIAEYRGWNGDWPCVYITADEPVYDMLVSVVNNINGYIDEQPYSYTVQRTAASDDWCIEVATYLYVPELMPGQAVCLPDRSFFIAHTAASYCRLAYSNKDGEFEVVLLTGGEYNCPPLMKVTPKHNNERYDEYFYEQSSTGSVVYSHLFPDDFSIKMLARVFDEYIPNGFCISSGSIGDINNDGIEDAIICLTTNGCHTETYCGIMPMLILLGRHDGGYTVEKRVPAAICTPYDDPSYPVAGNGYIDVVYEPYISAFISSWNQTSRFVFDEAQNDWLLKDICEQYTLDRSEEMQLALVRALPDTWDLPIEEFTRRAYYRSILDYEYFDAVGTMTVPSFSDYNTIFTLAIKLDKDAGYYEGYIHVYLENIGSGGFIQTVRGAYQEGSELKIYINESDISFTIYGDKWVKNGRTDTAFHLSNQSN